MTPLISLGHFIYKVASDPAFDATLLLLIIVSEIHAVYHDRIQTNEAKKQTAIAEDTYNLYKQYFETTEKRKADWREAQRKSRAAKRERLHATPEPEIEAPPEEPIPPPTNGHVPPLVLPEEEEHEEQP